MSITNGSNKLPSIYKLTHEEPHVSSKKLGTLDDFNEASAAHLNTFDKLDDEIQRSIAALKKMSN